MIVQDATPMWVRLRELATRRAAVFADRARTYIHYVEVQFSNRTGQKPEPSDITLVQIGGGRIWRILTRGQSGSACGVVAIGITRSHMGGPGMCISDGTANGSAVQTGRIAF